MILTTVLDDALADVLDYNRKLVAADVRMSVDKDRRVCTETDELVEDLTDVTSL